jgi:hypothetical protein
MRDNGRRKGIAVCDHWNKFENFLADMGERPDKSHQLTRLRRDFGFKKDNCKWLKKSDPRRVPQKPSTTHHRTGDLVQSAA